MLGQEGLNIPGRVMSRCVSPNPSGLATSPPAIASHSVSSPQVVHKGVAIRLEHVSVRAAGHTILTDLDIQVGSHVAIVGPSGAGKSSLVGLLLGWHRAASGPGGTVVFTLPRPAGCRSDRPRAALVGPYLASAVP